MLAWFRKRHPPTPPDDTASRAARIDAGRREGHERLARDDLAGAAACYQRVLDDDADDGAALTGLGFIHVQQARPDLATPLLERASGLQGVAHDAHYMLAGLREAAGDLAGATQHLEQALAQAPGFDAAAAELGRLWFTRGDPDRARQVLQAAIARRPDWIDHHLYLGNVEFSGQHDGQAAAHFRAALALEPRHPAAALNLALALQRLREWPAAAAVLEAALVHHPDDAGLLRELGNVRVQLGDLAAAVRCIQGSIARAPAPATVHSNLGHLLTTLGRFEPAVAACRAALAIDPALAAAYLNLGNALVELGRFDEAAQSFRRSLALEPAQATAELNLAQTLGVLKRPDEASAAMDRAMALDDHVDWLYGTWLHGRTALAQWDGFEAAVAELGRRLDRGERASTPWTLLSLPLSAEQQWRCADAYVRGKGLAASPPPPAWPRHGRLRIGYYSADFHDHATAWLMAELFERHDRSRFEVIAFSYGPASSHPMRARLEAGFERFIDVSALDDEAIVRLSREMQVDVAVDLKGFTEACRPRVFAFRAAPVQVTYLGYPGTLAAPFFDYAVADATVVPAAHLPWYSEKIVFMPQSYQVNDGQRAIAAAPPTRAELGLPEAGFVFCCFNNNYKLTPDVFDVWMRLLQQVPGSVLWLLEGPPALVANLRREASQRGVDPRRLVFAPRIDMPSHLSRQVRADLFLDTLYCNAHTTASDALWAGLPVLTCLGDAFASRVAGSLLRAAGLPELVTQSLADYERLALRLATEPGLLAALRQRLQAGRDGCALFDARRFARALESAFVTMVERHEAGLPPDHLHVADPGPQRAA